MGSNMKLLMALVACVAVVLTLSIPLAKAQDPNCNFAGNSACGGTDQGQCTPDERFYTENCSNGAVIHKCFVDNFCASVTKGRVNIRGGWQGGQYNIRQLGDSLTITGGRSGTATGQFIGPNQIAVRWPVANGAYTATITVNQFKQGVQINWDHPAGNIWRR
jgi:hypothetical protein